MPSPRLTVATCQIESTPDPAENARRIVGLIEQASAAAADVAHFSECALSGYCGTKRLPSWNGYDWGALRRATESVMDACGRHRIWGVIGSSHPLDGMLLPHNCVYVIDDAGTLRDRYDKRVLSMRDLKSYTPGDHETVFEIRNVRCGLMTCLEWAFPELFQSYANQGVDCIFHTASSAGRDGDDIFTHTIPAVMQAHAFHFQLFISLTNDAVPVQSFPGLWVRRSGRLGRTCERDRPGFIVSAIDDEPDKDAFYAMVRKFRADVRSGAFYRERLTSAPRSLHRRSL